MTLKIQEFPPFFQEVKKIKIKALSGLCHIIFIYFCAFLISRKVVLLSNKSWMSGAKIFPPCSCAAKELPMAAWEDLACWVISRTLKAVSVDVLVINECLCKKRWHWANAIGCDWTLLMLEIEPSGVPIKWCLIGKSNWAITWGLWWSSKCCTSVRAPTVELWTATTARSHREWFRSLKTSEKEFLSSKGTSWLSNNSRAATWWKEPTYPCIETIGALFIVVFIKQKTPRWRRGVSLFPIL